METVLQVNRISKTYARASVLDCVSMKIGKGDIYGFVGKNGASITFDNLYLNSIILAAVYMLIAIAVTTIVMKKQNYK